jgi:YVTN family beta-propeller protein
MVQWITNIKANSITIINTTTYKVIATLNTEGKTFKAKVFC